jgi:hypothetical protein
VIQEPGTIDHLLVGCVFARDFWFRLLGQVNLQGLAPHPGECSTMEWWRRASEQVQGIAEKGLNPLIMLGLWTLWNHRNGCVFERIIPSFEVAIRRPDEERELWKMARAKSLALLTARIPGV